MTLTLTLVILALLVGYALGKMAAPSYRGLEDHLQAIRSSLEELTKPLCGDKNTERAIRMLSADGGELSEEDLAYDGGSLNRIEREIRGFAERVETLAEGAKGNKQPSGQTCEVCKGSGKMPIDEKKN